MPDDDSECWEREPRLLEVVTAYLDAVGDGLVPDRQALLAEYSDVAAELEEFLEAQDHVARFTAPLREVARVATLPLLLAADSSGLDEEAGLAPDPRLAAVLEARGYELLGEGSRGGAGVVYKARQRRLNRLVAVKTIGVGRQVTPTDLQRFRNEAETLGGLSHPHTVPVYEVAEHDGRLFLFMPYLEGGNLADDLGSYRDDPRAAAQLVATVARAVHYAHRHGFLHRDLKPSNILRDRAGEPHVSDFGLARRLDADSDLTLSGAIVGTPSFMAPEQAQGRRGAPTTSTDVYGLGAVLYALLTGRPPFRGETPLDTIEMVRSTAPTRPRMLNPRVDRDLETICLKCLEKEPKARYGSAEALAEDLDRWLGGEPIEARSVGSLVRGWRWARRNPVVAGLLGLVGMLLVAGIVGLIVSNAAISRKNTEIVRQRNRAKQVVDDMYTQVAERLLLNVPGMEPVRRELLIKALRYYEEEAAQGNGSDAAARTEMANASFRVGRIHHLLSEIDLEVPAFLRAISLLEQLAKDFPNEPNHRLLLARSLNELGIAYWTKGRGPEAAEAYLRGLDTAEQAAAAFPERPEFREVMAKNLHNLAVVQHEAGRLAEAETNYRGAIRLREKLAAELPAHSAYRHELALGLGAFAKLLGDLPPPESEEAGQAFQQALDIEEKLVAEFPSNAGYRASAADLRNNLGGFLTTRCRHAEAEAVLRQALLDREKLAAQNPNLPENLARLGVAVQSLAESLRDQGKYGEASDLAKRAITYHQTALNASPKHPMYLAWLRSGYMLLAETLLSLGDSEKASEAAEAAIRVLPDAWDSFYFLACAYARCVPRLEKHPTLNDAQRRALALSVGDRAVGFLRVAIEKNYRLTGKLPQDDPELQSLRSFESFQRLIKELDRK
ncbi:MAG: protein kinase [Isosphaerales bacterium]